MFKKLIYTDFSFERKKPRILMLLSITMLLFGISMQGCYAIDSNSSSNSSNYSISILDSSVGGDVLANSQISQDIPRTNFSNQIFNMTKQGSVVLKFGNGNGPKMLISTGIHGNEVEANLAVMKYLEYIKDKSFNGTLYVIPFDIPKDTAINSRLYNGEDPNRNTNIIGTPGWKIVQFCLKEGVQYLLEVHSGTEVGSSGILITNSENTMTNQERAWASYITAHSNSWIEIGIDDYPGLMRTYANSLGINSMNMEVEINTIPTMTAAETEYKMVLAAAQYLGFPGTYSPTDTTPPTITSTNPVSNAVGVQLTSPVTITFSENILAGANYAGIYLKNTVSGASVSMNKSISGNTLTIQQTTTRISNTLYKVYIPAGAVKDAAGNNLAAAYSYYFTTISSGTTDITIADLKTAATYVKNYYETNSKTLPTSVQINGKTITMPQLLYLLTTATIQINSNNLNPITLKTVNPAPSPSGSIKNGNVQKTEFITLAQSIQSFINTNGRAPNYKTTTLGNLPFNYMVYLYSKIINYYTNNNRLPNYVTI